MKIETMPGLEKKMKQTEVLYKTPQEKAMESFVGFTILLGLSAASLSPCGWYRMLWNERAL